MRSRVALGVLLALAACKSKSEDAQKSTGGERGKGGPGAPGLAIGAGSGSSAPVAAHGFEDPAIANRVVSADESALQRAGGGPPPVHDAGADAVEAAPATSTPAQPEQQAIAAAPTKPGEAGDTAAALPAGKVRLLTKSALDVSALTADVVAAKISTSYLAILTRCYRTALAADPKLAGTVTLTWGVTMDGHTTSAEARGLGADVDNCVAESANAWRFPIPKGTTSEGFVLGRFSVSLGFSRD